MDRNTIKYQTELIKESKVGVERDSVELENEMPIPGLAHLHTPFLWRYCNLIWTIVRSKLACIVATTILSSSPIGQHHLTALLLVECPARFSPFLLHVDNQWQIFIELQLGTSMKIVSTERVQTCPASQSSLSIVWCR